MYFLLADFNVLSRWFTRSHSRPPIFEAFCLPERGLGDGLQRLVCEPDLTEVRLSRASAYGAATRTVEGETLGRPRTRVDAAQVAKLRGAGAPWKVISHQLGVGVGTACRAL